MIRSASTPQAELALHFAHYSADAHRQVRHYVAKLGMPGAAIAAETLTRYERGWVLDFTITGRERTYTFRVPPRFIPLLDATTSPASEPAFAQSAAPANKE